MRKALAAFIVLTATLPTPAADKLADRDAAIARIVRAGGVFQFDNRKSSRPPIRLDYSRDPSKSKPNLEDIKSLDSLREIHVVVSASEEDIEWVTSLPRLIELRCSDQDTSPTLAAMRHLRKAENLESLSLKGLSITDIEIAPIGDLVRLTALDLSDTNITDKGLTSLKTCRSLKALSVANTYVSGPGFADLKSLPHLERLALGSSKIDDSSIVSLIGCTEIKALSLHSVAMTDAGLRHLERMPNLRELNISGSSSLTDEGKRALVKKKPRLEFVR